MIWGTDVLVSRRRLHDWPQPAADSWLARGRSCRQAPSERPNRRCCPAQRLKSRQTNRRSASVWRGRTIGKLSVVSTRWQLGHREGRCGPSDKQASLVLHTDRSRAGASVTIEARANPRHTICTPPDWRAAGHSALTTDALVRFVIPRRFAGFPPVRLSLQSSQTVRGFNAVCSGRRHPFESRG